MRALSLAQLALVASVASITACTVTTTDTSSGSSGSGPSGSASSGSSTTGLTAGIPTNEMHPSFSVQDYGDGSGVHVYAAWLDDHGNWLTTSGGDVVTASSDGLPATTLYLESDEPGKVHYTTTFPSSDAPGVVHEVTIALTRPDGRGSAPSSTAYLGQNFSITTAVPKTMKQGDKLSIAVAPAPQPDVVGDGDSWQLTASGTCIADYLASTVSLSGTDGSTGLVDAQGQFRFDTSKLVQQGPSSSCDITVMVKHVHYSQLDPSYGSATAGLELVYSDAPASKNGDGTVDTSYAFEGLQARAFHTTFTFP